MKIVIFLFIALNGVYGCYGLPTGPPPAACNDMVPAPHGDTRLTTINYAINAPATFKPGTEVEVKIVGFGETMYKGLLLQVRNQINSKSQTDIVGTWVDPSSTNPNYRLHECNRSPSAGVCHSNRDNKMVGEVFKWKAPASCEHNKFYYIKATVVRSRVFYNAGIEKAIRCIMPPSPTSDAGTGDGRSTMPSIDVTTGMPPGGNNGNPGPGTNIPGAMSNMPDGMPNIQGGTNVASSIGNMQSRPTGNMQGGGNMFNMMKVTDANMMDDFRHANVALMENIKPANRNLYCANKWAIIPKGSCTSFEYGMAGWANIIQDPHGPRILRHKGPTKSHGTGPMKAQHGGYYTYFEATGQNFGAKAAIQSPMGLKGCFCFTFYYHMNTGGDASIGIGINNRVVGRIFGIQNKWVKKSISITTCDESISMFLGVRRGRYDNSDIAFDNFMFKPGTCQEKAIRFYLSCSKRY